MSHCSLSLCCTGNVPADSLVSEGNEAVKLVPQIVFTFMSRWQTCCIPLAQSSLDRTCTDTSLNKKCHVSAACGVSSLMRQCMGCASACCMQPSHSKQCVLRTQSELPAHACSSCCISATCNKAVKACCVCCSPEDNKLPQPCYILLTCNKSCKHGQVI